MAAKQRAGWGHGRLRYERQHMYQNVELCGYLITFFILFLNSHMKSELTLAQGVSWQIERLEHSIT